MSFTSDITGFNIKLNLVLSEVQKQVSKELRRELAVRTPKLTGRAAGSWNAQKGSPNDTIQPKEFNNPGGSVDAGIVNLNGLKLGEDVHVSNAIHYIRRLNDGYSRKAPAGFVEATVAGIGLIVSRATAAAKAKVGL